MSLSNMLDEDDILAILNEEDNPSLKNSDSEFEDVPDIIDDVQTKDENKYITEYVSSLQESCPSEETEPALVAEADLSSGADSVSPPAK
ncbi:hypothetical protein WA026_022189 [Henosepilachna vigintioctopunctata]|uniref:Uncharacterized protein n=1 Tax=Henosepilachna vigintioctopunctata TaxID=420089 RepID=A0AAW1UP84_9CUCU